MTISRLAIAGAALLAGLMITIAPISATLACSTAETGGSDEIGAIGSTVEPFTLTTYSGETFTNESLNGKVTLLIFWFPT